jgi:hypothetical protein
MGTGVSPSVLVHNEVQEPCSFAWFCPVCGRIWAKAVVEGQRFMVVTQPCDLEPVDNYYIVPGSLWLTLRPEYTKSLPREVLLREFQLHLAHYDRYHK